MSVDSAIAHQLYAAEGAKIIAVSDSRGGIHDPNGIDHAAAVKHKRETGGGAANEMLVHMLDIVLWYFGSVRSVRNLYTDTLLAERDVEGKSVNADAEDVVLLKIESTSGVQTICESDLVTPSYMNYVEIQGTNGSLWTSIQPSCWAATP